MPGSQRWDNSDPQKVKPPVRGVAQEAISYRNCSRHQSRWKRQKAAGAPREVGFLKPRNAAGHPQERSAATSTVTGADSEDRQDLQARNQQVLPDEDCLQLRAILWGWQSPWSCRTQKSSWKRAGHSSQTLLILQTPHVSKAASCTISIKSEPSS